MVTKITVKEENMIVTVKFNKSGGDASPHALKLLKGRGHGP